MSLRSASRIEALFEIYLAASERPVAEQGEFLRHEGLSDADRSLLLALLGSTSVSREIDALLREGFFEDAPKRDPGTPIGIYRIEGLIGTGGQGSVYLGTHARESVDRQVAIKLPNQTAGESLFAIRREARALAKLDHPAIARFLSVDRTDEGQVFLVTEYVNGRPLDAALHNADRSKVIAVFVQLSQALHHAHLHGVAHLDLKPSNVLIDGGGQPKVLDFGLGIIYAKEKPAGVAHGFTLPYAAPEQLAGEASPASDTFSLGAMLLQVLMEADSAALPRHIETIQSTQWKTYPGRRHLGRDMHAIVKRACARDPADRYSSIVQFGSDLRALAVREPVSARHWTWAYALTCLIRRRPVAACAVAAAVLLLAGATTVLVVQRTQLISAKAQATKDAERARVGLGLVVSAMEAAEPESTPQITDAERALVERLRRAAEKATDPEVRATADLVVSRIARSTGEFETALTVLDHVVKQAETQHATPLLADALTTQVETLVELSRFEQADAALARLRELPGGYDRRASALHAEGRRLIRAGKLDEGETLLQEALAAADNDGLRIKVINDLGTTLTDRGRNAEAALLFDRQRPLVDAAYGNQSVSYGVNAQNRALAYFGLTRSDDALKAAREAEAIYASRLGVDSLRYADAMMLEAVISLDDNSARAAECLQKSIAIYRASYGADHPRVAQVMYTLGTIYLNDGDAPAALREFQSAAAIAKVRLDNDHPLVATLKQAEGAADLALGHPDVALPLLQSALTTFEAVNASPDITKAIVQSSLSKAYRLLGRANESDVASRYAYELAVATLPVNTLERAQFVMERAASLAASEKIDAAQSLFAEARAAFDAQAARPATRKARPELERIGEYIAERARHRATSPH